MSYANRLALVTGASSGLGADFARQLAQAGCRLVITARRQPQLEQLADELEQQYGRRPVVHSCDLSCAEQREALARAFPAVEILINNAGLGVFGPFNDSDWHGVARMLEVDIAALTHLTHLFLPGMRQRRWGRILQVASTAAFQPCPHLAVYAAAKSYVRSFSLAVNQEWKGSGVTSTCLCPGPTATEFAQVSGMSKSPFAKKGQMTSPEVVSIALRALQARQPLVISGRMNALLAFSTRFLPTSLLTMAADLMLKPPARPRT